MTSDRISVMESGGGIADQLSRRIAVLDSRQLPAAVRETSLWQVPQVDLADLKG